MRTIWKFDLADEFANARAVDGTPVIPLALPADAALLAVQAQKDRPMLWVDLDDAEPRATRYLAILGTGCVIPAFIGEWVGTWQEGTFVWHLYAVDAVQYELAADQAGAA